MKTKENKKLPAGQHYSYLIDEERFVQIPDGREPVVDHIDFGQEIPTDEDLQEALRYRAVIKPF